MTFLSSDIFIYLLNTVHNLLKSRLQRMLLNAKLEMFIHQ